MRLTNKVLQGRIIVPLISISRLGNAMQCCNRINSAELLVALAAQPQDFTSAEGFNDIVADQSVRALIEATIRKISTAETSSSTGKRRTPDHLSSPICSSLKTCARIQRRLRCTLSRRLPSLLWLQSFIELCCFIDPHALVRVCKHCFAGIAFCWVVTARVVRI